jgi:outer membrane protein assembly factor BamD (BamD/ComL family)
VLITDPEDKERWRLEGYLPKDDFRAFLEMGLARLAFITKDWADAERRYAAVIEDHPNSFYAPEAVYYRGVSRYSASHDAGELANTGALLTERYPATEWQLRSIPWLHEKSETTTG